MKTEELYHELSEAEYRMRIAEKYAINVNEYQEFN